MYLSETEQFYKRSIDERIADERLLEVEYVIDNGNRCNIRNTNGQSILMGLTIEQAYWVVHGICNFYNKSYPEKVKEKINMAYQRKTKDIYELVTNYGYGEEVESWAETFEEIKGDFDAYIKEKMGGYMPELKSIRIRKRRERIV